MIMIIVIIIIATTLMMVTILLIAIFIAPKALYIIENLNTKVKDHIDTKRYALLDTIKVKYLIFCDEIEN